MKKLLLLAFGILVALPALSQVLKIEGGSNFTEQNYSWSFLPGTINSDITFQARGYVRFVVEPNDTASYVYTLSRAKKDWGPDSVFVDAIAFNQQSGVVVQDGVLGGVDKSDWIQYGIKFNGKRTKLVYRYALADVVKGQVQFRTGSVVGPVICTIELPVTGAWNNFQTVEGTMDYGDKSGQVVPIFLTFSGSLRPTGSGGNIDAFWFK